MWKTSLRGLKTNAGRRGAAAVELAVASPVLVLLLLGTLDLGQFVNMGEVISNTSRIAARKASRSFTFTQAEVKAAAVDHLDNHFANIDRQTLENATTVTLTHANGAALSDAYMKDTMRSGEQMVVTVTFDYSAVRWVGNGFAFLGNKNLSFTTTIRRL